MTLFLRASLLGYGTALLLALWSGASLVGWGIAWVGGAMLTLGLAYAATLVWPEPIPATAAPGADAAGPGPDAAAWDTAWKAAWEADLASERFAADLRDDRAADPGAGTGADTGAGTEGDTASGTGAEPAPDVPRRSVS